jgi:hypothetical protein
MLADTDTASAMSEDTLLPFTFPPVQRKRRLR